MSQPKSPFHLSYFAVTLVASAVVSTLFGFTAGFLAGNEQVAQSFFARMPMMRSIWPELAMKTPAVAALTHRQPAVAAADEESQIIAAVKKATPAVVSIVITKEVPVYEQTMGNAFGNNDFFQQFFGNAFPQMQVPQYQQKGTEKQKVGAGSGFIVSADGYMVTNRHVVQDTAAEYTAILADGRKFPVKVLARDSANDIAILKIDGTKLPFLTFADSDKLQVGQKAIAIGYALGEFGNTVSTGVVAGLKRSLQGVGDGVGTENLFGVIQTDAAINPGNSGGPLLNKRGEVIGVNVAIVQGSQNIGFSLPSNDVKKAVESVKKNGKISRPYLGVRFAMITKAIKEANNLSVDYGAIIVRGQNPTDLAVSPGSPADKAGFLENDIVLEANGQKINEDLPLDQALGRLSANDQVKFKILRKGDEMTLTATLGEKK